MSEASAAEPVAAPAPRLITRTHPANLLAAAAMLLSGALLLHWLSRLTFMRDEWDFLLHRRSWSPGTFLHPFGEQLLAIPILIYKVLVAAFGIDSAAPFQIVSVLLFLLSAGVLYVYVRRGLGEWLALAAVLPILFLGASWDDLLFPFQMALFGSMACGIAALLVLDRRDRAGDYAATGLLIGSLFFFALGIAFVAAVTVELAVARERVRRFYVVAVPTALWMLWYLGWGHSARTFISVTNAAHLPSYVLDGLSASLATLLGLGVGLTNYQTTSLDWGRPLLVLAAILVGWRIHRLGRVSPRLAAALTATLMFWSLTALNTNPLAPPTAGRYQYIGAILLVLVAVELLRGVRVGRWATAAIVLVAAASALTNGTRLRDAARTLDGIAQQERGGLGAIELARDRVDPGLELTPQNSGVDYLGVLDAGSYLSAIDAYGSPAYSAAELATAPELSRVAADRVSAAALGIGLKPASGVQPGSCAQLNPGAAPAIVSVPPEGVVLRARVAGTEAALRRYASASFPVVLGDLSPRSSELLQIPADRSPRGWSLQLTGGGPVSACRARGS